MLYESLGRLESSTQKATERTMSQVLIIAKADFAVDGMVSLLDSHKDRYMVATVDPDNFVADHIRTICPDVLLLNSNVSDRAIDECIRELHGVCSETRILLFGHDMTDNYLYQAMRAGARGYLNDKMRGDHLTTALDTVMSGGYWAERHILCQFISDKSVHDKIDDNVTSLSTRLTNRESEVLELILEGMTTNEIADKIFLSHQGVKAHLTNLFRKFEVKNRAQLIIRALDEISPVMSISELAGKGLRHRREQAQASRNR